MKIRETSSCFQDRIGRNIIKFFLDKLLKLRKLDIFYILTYLIEQIVLREVLKVATQAIQARNF